MAKALEKALRYRGELPDKQKIFRRGLLPIMMLLAAALIIAFPEPASALNPSEYFTFEYTSRLSDTEVSGSKPFTLDVTVAAVCKKDLPVSISAARITGSVIAENRDTGDKLILYPSYTFNISDDAGSFPTKAGQSYEVTQSLELIIPAGSESGSYNIAGEIIQGRIKYGIWVDVTKYLPGVQPFAVMTYTASSEPVNNPGDSSDNGNYQESPAPAQTPVSEPAGTPDISRTPPPQETAAASPGIEMPEYSASPTLLVPGDKESTVVSSEDTPGNGDSPPAASVNWWILGSLAVVAGILAVTIIFFRQLRH
jgi:hypothetical protein